SSARQVSRSSPLALLRRWMTSEARKRSSSLLAWTSTSSSRSRMARSAWASNSRAMPSWAWSARREGARRGGSGRRGRGGGEAGALVLQVEEGVEDGGELEELLLELRAQGDRREGRLEAGSDS